MEILEAVLATGSTIAAAEQLHVSQPVVSRTIKHAERNLGYTIFHRQGGRLHPTPEALALLPKLEAFFSHWHRIQDYAENLATGELTLNIAVNPALADILPPAVLQVRKLMPNIRFSLLTAHTKEITDRLLSGGIDIGIGQGYNAPQGFNVETLGYSQLNMLIPRGWEISQPQDIRQLANRPFIGTQRDYGLAETIDAFFEQEDLEFDDIATVETYHLAAVLTAQGLGVTIVDQFTAAAADTTRVQTIPLTSLPQFLVQCFSHPKHVPGKAEIIFRNAVKQILKSPDSGAAAIS